MFLKTTWTTPLLFAIYPILFLYSRNMDEIAFSETFPLLCGSALFSIILWSALSLLTRSKAKASLCLSIFLLLFFSYGALHTAVRDWTVGGFEIGRERYLILSNLFVLGSISVIVWRRPNWVDPLRSFLSKVVLVLFAIVLLQIAWGWRDEGSISDQGREALELVKPEICPDIYYLVFDAYGRGDILQEFYNYDNTAFLDRLREMGFYVAEESRANYPMTALSTACTLNLDYLDTMVEDFDGNILDSYNFRPLIAKIKNNRVFQSLKPLGYKTVAYAPGVSVVDLKNGDIYYSPELQLTAFQNGLLNMTPIPILLTKFRLKSQFDLHRDRILFTLDHLPDMAKRENTEEPVFVFAHLICPHPPFVFDAQGDPIGQSGGMAFMEEDNIWRRHEQGEEYRKRYVDQLEFLSGRILEVVEEILTESKEPPLIILQSDHGPGLELKWDNPGEKTYRERLSILNAYHLPDVSAEAVLYPSITPVNTFRTILREFFEADLDPLPNRSFFSTPKKPYRWHEVDFEKIEATMADN